jgi:hypothetical protein
MNLKINITSDILICVIIIIPESGRITRISKDTAIQILASFNVFVPHQAPPSLLNPFPNASANEIEFITRLLTVVISFSIIIVVIMLVKGYIRV